MTVVAAVAWFDPDDYEAFRSILPERNWHDTYEDWLLSALDAMERGQDAGALMMRAPVRSHAFVEWCWESGNPVKTTSLAIFADHFASNASQMLADDEDDDE